MEVASIVAIVIILGLGYWMSESAKEKAETEAKHKEQDEFMSLVSELDVDGISDGLLSWLEAKIRVQTGQDGLRAYTEELKGLIREDGKQAAVVQLMLVQQKYLEEKQNTEERMQWHRYIETFRQMNKAQQKYEIEKIKKAARPGSDEDDEKLHLLELIHLGDDGKTTDVMIGGVKLFTLKEK